MDLKSKIILISGPTASGKSNFAVNLAKKIKGERQIFIAKEPNYDELKIKALLYNLNYYLKKYDNKKLIQIMRNFLIKEIKV